MRDRHDWVALDAADRALQSRIHYPHAPPTAFLPASASARELALYGYPPQPDREAHPTRYEAWLKAVSTPHRMVRARPTADFRRQIPVALPVRDDPITFGARNAGGANVLPSDVGTAGEPAVFVSGFFWVPQVKPSMPLSDQIQLSIWVGMDAAFAPNYLPDRVLQAGVKAILTPGQPTSYQAFFEWNVTGHYSPAQYFDGFPVSAGDRIQVLVCASDPNRGQIYVTNETQEVSTSIGIDAVPGFPALGSSVQWAVEASVPIGLNWAPSLPDFGALWWADCQAGTRTHNLPLSQAKPAYAINPSGTHLTQTVFLPNGLVVIWEHPG